MPGLASLLRKGVRSLSNTGRTVSEHSSLKILVVSTFGIFLLAGLTVLFYAGFHFLDKLGGMGLMVMHRLFALFFFGLGLMLAFSSLVSSYSTLYRSEEIPHLLLRPLSHGVIAVHKCLEAAVLSSWAFFFMIIPFIAAFAWQQQLPLTFPLWTFVFAIPFVLLCSSLGSLVCMVLVRWLPTGRTVLLAGLLIAVATVAALSKTMALGPIVANDDSTLVLNKLIPGLRVASQPFWPSWWVSEGIMSLAREDWGRGFMLWGVLMANMLMAGVVIDGVGQRIFYDGWQRGLNARIRSARRGAATRRLGNLLVFAGRDVRALIVKDARMFLRDPLQWSQGAVFFGLLAIYFLNLRNLRYDLLGPVWHNLIVFLNMISVTAVICSLSSRFIYPQMSMEGHSFWVAGLSPLSMRKILMTKFRSAAALLVLTSAALMQLTLTMLRVESWLYASALAVAVALPLGITGLSVGLGAVFLDLRQRNPSAIVSSFGGTLNLVLGMGYALVSVLSLAMVFHLRGVGAMSGPMFRMSLAGAAAGVVALTALATWYPLRMGCRRLMESDY